MVTLSGLGGAPSMALAGQFRLKTQTGSKRGQTGHRALTRHLQALLWLRAGVSPSEEETLGSRAVQTHVLIAAISRHRPHQLPRPPRESHLPPKAGGGGRGRKLTPVWPWALSGLKLRFRSRSGGAPPGSTRPCLPGSQPARTSGSRGLTAATCLPAGP